MLRTANKSAIEDTPEQSEAAPLKKRSAAKPKLAKQR
jgi:hypothetical protein